MLIYGNGGHAKVVKEIITSMGEKVAAIFDSGELASETSLEYKPDLFAGEKMVVAIGDNMTRKLIAEQLYHSFGSAIHPSSIVSPSATIGEGSMILHNVVVQADASIGKHTIINTSSVVEHDCIVGDYCHIAPKGTLCGNVSIGEGSLLGAGAIVLPGISIGKWCVVGAGSVVTKNIPDFSIALGNPALIVRKNAHFV
ncbi:MAG TPA: acetyltransferase [Cytophagaceae bacterium]|jgi:sugar O-acyltransferase (sialic acid O-acetyltransferase NeuD family)